MLGAGQGGIDPPLPPPRGGPVPENARKLLRNPAVVLPVAVLLVVGGWLVYRSSTKSSASAAATERTVTATSGTMAQTISSSGTIEPESTEELSFASSGTVTAVKVKAGQQVDKGQVLATIDSAALQSAVTSAQASVDSAQAKLDSDESASASSEQISADQANLTSAQASLGEAETNLAGATLTSPIKGTVATVNLTVGQQLGSSGGSGNSPTGTSSGGGVSTPSSSSSS
jgi:multidrug efflux pump subunit AcrA (membrane-fusion protein)